MLDGATPSRDQDARLAALLAARGRHAPALLESCAAQAEAEGRPLSALLAERGHLEAAEVERLLRALAADPGETRVQAAHAEETAVHAPAVGADPHPRGPTAATGLGLWQPGSRVGAYVLVRHLGAGGMGVVYVAQHTETGAQVALKTLAPAADEEARERFVREAEAQARVDAHRNVVKVHTLGEAVGLPYLVMELALGGDLAQRLDAGPLDAQVAASVARDLARGLAHVHAQGVLHRDLKPANVLFDAHGTPKLVDFGLAYVAGAHSLTQTGTIMGTPATMSPEQALAEARVGPASDVYGLGVLLYRMLTGRYPFAGGSTLATLRAVVEDTPPAPSVLRPGLDPALEALCLRCLEKAPSARPPSAAALADALDAWLEGERDLGSPSPPWRRVALALAALLLAGVAAAAFTWPKPGGEDPAAPEDGGGEAGQPSRDWEDPLRRAIQAGDGIPRAVDLARSAKVGIGDVAQASAPAWAERAREAGRADAAEADRVLVRDLRRFLEGSEDASVLSKSEPLWVVLDRLLQARIEGSGVGIPDDGATGAETTRTDPATGTGVAADVEEPVAKAGLEVVRLEESMAQSLRPRDWPPVAFKRFLREFMRLERARAIATAGGVQEVFRGRPEVVYACVRVGGLARNGVFDWGILVTTLERATGRQRQRLFEWGGPEGQVSLVLRFAWRECQVSPEATADRPARLEALRQIARAIDAAQPAEAAPEFRAGVKLRWVRAEERAPPLTGETQEQAARRLWDLLNQAEALLAEASGEQVGEAGRDADEARWKALTLCGSRTEMRNLFWGRIQVAERLPQGEGDEAYRTAWGVFFERTRRAGNAGGRTEAEQAIYLARSRAASLAAAERWQDLAALTAQALGFAEEQRISQNPYVAPLREFAARASRALAKDEPPR